MPRLWLLTDPLRLPDPMPILPRLPRGAAVLARGMPEAALPPLAGACRRRGLRLLVGGDGRLALRLAAGLHVPERGAPGLLAFLRARRPGALLSAACHGLRGLARGRRLRCDALLLSPLFPTDSHPEARPFGPHGWAWLARGAGRACIALGGIRPATLGRVPPIATGVAAIGWWRGLEAGLAAEDALCQMADRDGRA
ncbi:MAG: thiamine phosphate synthase [Geminicoccaceae bacterium]|nr:thiamine phosphate synthase [Geminicoccaceae bacterium]